MEWKAEDRSTSGVYHMHTGSAGLPKSTELPYFYSTSTIKLVLMLIGSFGLYSIFWFYRNWILIRERTEKRLHPAWRALLSVIWASACCKFIKEAIDSAGLEDQKSPVPYGVAYSCLTLIEFAIPNDEFSLTLIISILANSCLIPVNQIASRANRIVTSDFEQNNTFSKWDKVILIVGGIFWIFVMIVWIRMMISPSPRTPSYKLR